MHYPLYLQHHNNNQYMVGALKFVNWTELILSFFKILSKVNILNSIGHDEPTVQQFQIS